MVTWEYFAGFVDADGYIGLVPYDNSKYKNSSSSKGIRCVINITQKNRPDKIIYKLKEFLDDNNINSHITHNRNRIDIIQLRLSHRKHISKFLHSISDFLIVKKEAATNMLNFIETKWGVYD